MNYDKRNKDIADYFVSQDVRDMMDNFQKIEDFISERFDTEGWDELGAPEEWSYIEGEIERITFSYGLIIDTLKRMKLV